MTATAAASGGTCMRRSSNSLRHHGSGSAARVLPWRRAVVPSPPPPFPVGIAAAERPPTLLLLPTLPFAPQRSILAKSGKRRSGDSRGNRGSKEWRERAGRSGGRGDQLRSDDPVGGGMSMSGSDFGAPCDDPKIFRNICRDRILKDLLKPDKDKEIKSSWKVLIMDKFTVRIMAYACKMAEITDAGISLVEDLFK